MVAASLSITSARLARLVGRDQHPFGLGRRQTLVPQQDGQGRQLVEIARHRARRLRSRPLASVEVYGKAQHQAGHPVFVAKPEQSRGIGGEFRFPDRLQRRCNTAVHVTECKAEGLGAGVDADQPPAFRQDSEECTDILESRPRRGLIILVSCQGRAWS